MKMPPVTASSSSAFSMHAVASAEKRLADDLLVMAGAIEVGGVEHRHAAVERRMDHGDAGGIVARPVDAGQRHAAEPDRRHLHSAGAELALRQMRDGHGPSPAPSKPS